MEINHQKENMERNHGIMKEITPPSFGVAVILPACRRLYLTLGAVL
jgi:hypothetical protein